MSIALEKSTWTIALVGNPNTGKSTLFGALSGVAQRTGNYPGVTVEKKVGEVVHDGRRWLLVDLPGTYSLAPRSPDEMVTVDVLLGRRDDVPPPDVIVCVAAAGNLWRNLYLASQVLELGRPVVLALTMNDLAEAEGTTVDVRALADRLGIPVVPVQARRGEGLDALKAAVEKAGSVPPPAPPRVFPEEFRREVDDLAATMDGTPRYLVERLLLDPGSYIVEGLELADAERDALRARLVAARARLAEAGFKTPDVETTSRYAWVGRATDGVVRRSDDLAPKLADRLDSVLAHGVLGSLVLVGVLLLTFSAVFTWATVPMDWIDAGFAALGDWVQATLPEGPIRDLIVGGVIAGVGGVVIFLPQIVILIGLLAILEECGYLARAAYLMDRIMSRVGLSGRSFIPLLSSFACAIPGVMATRTIEDRRDRLTTILIAPLMSCSARLPVYTLMIGAFIPARAYLNGWVQLQGLTLLGMYLLGIVVAAAMALILKRSVLRGGTPAFVMELPAYQWPSPVAVVRRMLERGWDFLANAGTIIFAVSIVMWGLLYYPRLSTEELAPLLDRQAQAESALETARSSGDEEATAAAAEAVKDAEAHIAGAQQRQSILGRMGRWIEPAVRPLGWDWRIGAAALASFPAREVVVSTLGVIFDVGEEVEDEGEQRLTQAVQSASWPDGRPLFTIPVALSIMVFFALCAQCVSTLAVMWRETGSWTWPALSFAYMTTLAYIGALLTYQIGTWLLT
ncbi:ferrous iron transport protein B [Paludisphaera sp.]|uniref:ferrous iron transport protein B n=1 Tax=Paludisphaera sp. TaxID=2017432 RepID=UPI00301DA137